MLIPVYQMFLLDGSYWFYRTPPRQFLDDASCRFDSSFRMKFKMHPCFSTSELFFLELGIVFIFFRVNQTFFCCSHKNVLYTLE